MPIDGHAYLVSQGWGGKGTGLRHGAISKPIAVNQKKTLSGIGKDRDEAFPFWDHVFSAAASKIKVKVALSESEGDSESDTENTEDGQTTRPHLHRTSTGIISNRRPVTGTSALSGSTTPSSSGTSTPRTVSLLTAAKQEAARRTLYSMFYRGPIMRSDDILQDVEPEKTVEVVTRTTAVKESEPVNEVEEVEGRPEGERADKLRKRKSKKGKERERQDVESAGEAPKGHEDLTNGASVPKKKRKKDDSEDSAERKKRKEEKRARKEEKRRLKAERKAQEVSEPDPPTDNAPPTEPPQDVLADVETPNHVLTTTEDGRKERKKRKKGGQPTDETEPKPKKKRRRKEADGS